jgi:hypothetical protein
MKREGPEANHGGATAAKPQYRGREKAQKPQKEAANYRGRKKAQKTQKEAGKLAFGALKRFCPNALQSFPLLFLCLLRLFAAFILAAFVFCSFRFFASTAPCCGFPKSGFCLEEQ